MGKKTGYVGKERKKASYTVPEEERFVAFAAFKMIPPRHHRGEEHSRKKKERNSNKPPTARVRGKKNIAINKLASEKRPASSTGKEKRENN